jgi:hypothetical protein
VGRVVDGLCWGCRVVSRKFWQGLRQRRGRLPPPAYHLLYRSMLYILNNIPFQQILSIEVLRYIGSL